MHSHILTEKLVHPHLMAPAMVNTFLMGVDGWWEGVGEVCVCDKNLYN